MTGTALPHAVPGRLLWDAFFVLLAYAMGAVCAGYYLVRARTGLDLRREGSGALGGSNAARVLGPWGLWAVGTFDDVKGAVAVLVAQAAGLEGIALGGAVVAVVLGHVAPAQLGFHGGRGIMTGFAAFLVYYPLAALAMLLATAAAYAATRRRMPSGMVGLAAAPGVVLIVDGPGVPFVSVAATALLIAAAHRRRYLPAESHAAARSQA